MKKVKTNIIMVMIPGTDQVTEYNNASIAPDANSVNQLSQQKVLKDLTDGSQQNDGDPVVRPLTDAENSYYSTQQTAAQQASQAILDAATTNIVNGTLPNAGASE